MAELPKRHTIRWQGYDYAQQGAYFLTIVTDDRRPLFGQVVGGVLHATPIGMLAQQCWDAIPDHMPHVDVGEFVVMPNHVHGIVMIRERLVDVRGRALGGGVGADGVGARHDAPLRDPRKPPGIPHGALGSTVRRMASYRSAVTRMAYRDGLLTQGTPVWQR